MAQLSEENIEGVILVRISGSLTVAGVEKIEARLDALAGSNAVRVIADIGRVDTVTTPAITLMLRTARAIEKRGGVMVFANATPRIRRIFECCRLDLVMNLVSDVPAAMRLMRARQPELLSTFFPLSGGGGDKNVIH